MMQCQMVIDFDLELIDQALNQEGRRGGNDGFGSPAIVGVF